MTALDYLDESPECPTLPVTPPKFGHALLAYFQFEPGFVNLNIGSEGAVPSHVQRACDELARQSEASPDKWKKLIRVSLVEATRKRVAPLLGKDVSADELVFVTTSSHAIDMVLSSFDWRKGDVILYLSTTWKGAKGQIAFIRDTHGVRTAVYDVQFPTTPSAILSGFRAHLQLVNASLPRISSSGPTSPKIVAVIDAICSKPGVKFPWEDMVRIAREEGAYSVVDAAHCLGQQTDIDLGKAAPDFWVTSCHKWFYAHRGCSLLYVPNRNQHLIKAAFPHNSYPSSPSSTLQEKIEGATTRDFTSFLSVNAAFDFRLWLGGEYQINAYCHTLALTGGRRMAQVFGTRLMDESPNGSNFTANMVNIKLPLSPLLRETHDIVHWVDSKLLSQQLNVYGLVYQHGSRGEWWVRCCAQVWNEVSDFEYFAKVLLALCGELERTFLPS